MIIGLTDRPAAPPQLGTLRKGAPKPENGNKPGADLEYFRFDSEDKEAVERFTDIYGAKPRAIRIYVPFPTTDENFDAWREEWAASSLKHRCNGQTCEIHLTAKGTYSKEPVACPYLNKEKKDKGCKQVGRLKLIIPELRRFAIVTALTTSEHDIRQLHSNLLAIEGLRRSRGKDLCGVPLILKRSPQKISTPAADGKRARREKWLLSIEPEPEWFELQLAAQQQAELPQGETLALPEWDGEEDEIEEAPPVQTPAPMISEESIHYPLRRQPGAAPAISPAKPVPAPIETAADSLIKDYTKRIKAIIADQGKSQEWFAYEKKYVAGKSLAELQTLLNRLEIAGSKKLIEEIEGPLLGEFGLIGVSGKEIIEKIAQIADGECGLEQMEYLTLVSVRDGLNAWLGQLKQEAATVAPF